MFYFICCGNFNPSHQRNNRLAKRSCEGMNSMFYIASIASLTWPLSLDPNGLKTAESPSSPVTMLLSGIGSSIVRWVITLDKWLLLTAMESSFVSFVFPDFILLMRLSFICWSHFERCCWWFPIEWYTPKLNNKNVHRRSEAIGYWIARSFSVLQRHCALMENIKIQVHHLQKLSHISASKLWPFCQKTFKCVLRKSVFGSVLHAS